MYRAMETGPVAFHVSYLYFWIWNRGPRVIVMERHTLMEELMIRVKGLGRGLVVAYDLLPNDWIAFLLAFEPLLAAHSRTGTLRAIVMWWNKDE